MFLKNYIPRSNKIDTKNNLRYVKFALLSFFFCTILITFIFSIEDENEMIIKKEELRSNLNRNILKLENAKLIGNDKNNRPYVITAKSSFKNSIDKNIIHLNSVEADMTLNNNSWMLINTGHAFFNVLEKSIKAKDKVFIFYDDGTKLESTELDYNISKGVGYGDNGVKMFGKWGVIEANSFFFDTSHQMIKFYNNPKLTLN